MSERKKVTLPYLFNKVANHEPITWLTCYDYPTAYLMEQAGMDMILVGDSLAMTMLGYETTLPATMEKLWISRTPWMAGTPAAAGSITNRAAVIPILVRAGVPLNATDDNGFTPLMYAATVDVGDTETLNALLSSGADRKIRNDQGRTPLDQARHYKHTRIADALRSR